MVSLATGKVLSFPLPASLQQSTGFATRVPSRPAPQRVRPSCDHRTLEILIPPGGVVWGLYIKAKSSAESTSIAIESEWPTAINSAAGEKRAEDGFCPPGVFFLYSKRKSGL